MKHRPTKKAYTDIAGILRSTRKMFGPQQVLAYADIISDGIDMVAADPSRVNCRLQDGRIGRLLIPLMMKWKGATRSGSAFIGEAVHADKDLVRLRKFNALDFLSRGSWVKFGSGSHERDLRHPGDLVASQNYESAKPEMSDTHP